MNRLFSSLLILVIIAIGTLSFTACTPEATPFPVDIPTPESTTQPLGSTSNIRYALAANTEGYMSELSLIQAAAQVEQLTEPINAGELGSRYDIVVTYGDLPDGVHSPVTPHIALVVRPAIPPLDHPFLINILYSSLNPQTIVDTLDIIGAVADKRDPSLPAALRTELANAGWPDGLSLSIAYADTPGALEVANDLEAAGIQARLFPMNQEDMSGAFDEGLIQGALIAWKTPNERTEWVERFGEANVIDLYSIPISYLAIPGMEVTFTPGGWPLPTTG
jgi:hypothetical protein